MHNLCGRNFSEGSLIELVRFKHSLEGDEAGRAKVWSLFFKALKLLSILRVSCVNIANKSL